MAKIELSGRLNLMMESGRLSCGNLILNDQVPKRLTWERLSREQRKELKKHILDGDILVCTDEVHEELLREYNDHTGSFTEREMSNQVNRLFGSDKSNLKLGDMEFESDDKEFINYHGVRVTDPETIEKIHRGTLLAVPWYKKLWIRIKIWLLRLFRYLPPAEK